jgi:chemosensory pili system protein ChpA (sensor histidine kinase/response regulator)
VLTILLIEDAPVIREPLTRLLRIEGFQVLSAADGTEAFTQLEQRAVDLVLLDVLMPHMNGVTFLESMRRDARWKDLPVIAVTGIADTTKLTRLRELGVRSILHKVRFTFDTLVSEIHAQLPQAAT